MKFRFESMSMTDHDAFGHFIKICYVCFMQLDSHVPDAFQREIIKQTIRRYYISKMQFSAKSKVQCCFVLFLFVFFFNQINQSATYGDSTPITRGLAAMSGVFGMRDWPFFACNEKINNKRILKSMFDQSRKITFKHFYSRSRQPQCRHSFGIYY